MYSGTCLGHCTCREVAAYSELFVQQPHINDFSYMATGSLMQVPLYMLCDLCFYVCKCMHVFVCMYVCTCVYMYVCMYTYDCVCMCVCVCVCVCVFM